MPKKLIFLSIMGLLIVGFVVCEFASAQDHVPAYKVDAGWPKELPNNWIMGQVSGIAVDREDHVWVLQRPGSNAKDDLAAAQNPPVSQCCVAAPPVLEFDGAGKLLKSWGGPGSGYEWPTSEHSIFVDTAGNVWITGNGASDRQAIKFTSDGKFIMQIGHASKAPINSLDTSLLGRPAGMDIDEKAHELYIADGYGNRRVIVFDSESGKFKRMWGAYGSMPEDAEPGPYDPSAAVDKQFRTPLHCVHLASDGLVYVCDRVNDRIQVFTKKESSSRNSFCARKRLAMGPPMISRFRETRVRTFYSWQTAKTMSSGHCAEAMERCWAAQAMRAGTQASFIMCTKSSPILKGTCTPEKWRPGGGLKNSFC